MNPSDKDSLIERYLLHQLNEDEQASFEEKLLYSQSLRTEVERMEQLIAAVRTAEHIESQKISVPEIGARTREKPAPSKPVSSNRLRTLFGGGFVRRLLPAATLAVVLLATFLWILYVNQSSPEPKIPELTNIRDSSDTDGRDSAFDQTGVPGPKEPNDLIATAARFDGPDFEPNPYLEDLITDNLRSTQKAFTLSKPEDGTVLTANAAGRAEFAIAGTAPSSMRTVTFKLFRNDKESYVADKTVFSETVPVEGRSFQMSKTLNIEPGLYYLVLERDNEIVHVIRVFVAGKK